MPQDIPLERSETLRFTPASLVTAHDAGKIETLPVFTLGTPSGRDKRARQRWLASLGVRAHTKEALRAEMLAGAKAMWGEEQFAAAEPVITAYWAAIDDFGLQQKDDPDLVWSYDPATERSVQDLWGHIAREWRPFGRMLADNVDFGNMGEASLAAIGVRFWKDLDAEIEREDGALTPECVEEIEKALGRIEEQAGLRKGVAWAELLAACISRKALTEEEAGNSASPSPSDPPPPSSKTGDELKATAAPDGTSKASPKTADTSPKTPATA